MTSTQRVDAIVIGGGPAGAMAALHLARSGWSVRVFERGDGSHVKTCGCCLSPNAVRLLKDAGLGDEVGRLASGRTTHLALHRRDGSHTKIPIDADGECGLVVRRPELDQLLRTAAAEAGAVIEYGARASFVDQCESRTNVEVRGSGAATRFKADLIVAADGLASVVARSVGIVYTRRCLPAFGIGFDIECGNSGLDAEGIHMFVSERGYLGIVVFDEHVLHCAALARRGSAANHPEIVRRLVSGFPAVASTGLADVERERVLRFGACGPMPSYPNAVASGSVVLVGDAAGYAEPFTGQGIEWALVGASVLGKVVRACRPGEWNTSASQSYEERWRARVGRRQRAASVLGWGLRHPVSRWALLSVPGVLPPLGRVAARGVLAS